MKDVEKKIGGGLADNFDDFMDTMFLSWKNWKGVGQFWSDVTSSARGVTWFSVAYLANLNRCVSL